jgi:hypothetical protein
MILWDHQSVPARAGHLLVRLGAKIAIGSSGKALYRRIR